MQGIDDKTIVKFQKGDQNAFKKIFTILYPVMCSFGQKYISDKDEVEDTVQDVFIELWMQHTKYTDLNQVKAFLYLSIKNKCLNIIKHLKVKERHATATYINNETSEDFEGQVIKSEVISQINCAINNLPEQRRKIILLNMQGLKNEEIAENLNISINTVKLQKKIAYQKLREELKSSVFSILL
ncbi:MAG: RNA polymerase sigma-70 factor [Bacteroidales bacterium]|nr:RNA polymerase sigma-70 factor [Bacteroidales bacterium]